ncbi:helix-turn-helix domain-containing protein [Streptomyces sp. NRRL F-4428]|uniref:helix-turn-helix domain-containing protein n=1 Tax=Streptomyces sp. NRRL F-4428 TaxID=1609137 RepID=UPI0005EC840E|nr:helix-turn-helix transcriptional regulator [Streptomyces sp. NRRL F-4428]KJK46050.1 XRE family transcriptional regulator [Streptomyces sp. NRRL F-4428]
MTDDLGTLLRALRDAAQLTQEQVAEQSGVSVRTIRRLESGTSTNHRMGTVNLLADALELGEEDRRRLAAAIARPRGESVPQTDGSVPRSEAESHGEPGSRPPQDPDRVPGHAYGVVASIAEPGRPPGDGLPGPAASATASAAPAPSPVHPVLADAVRELAMEVRRRWRREEGQRRVHDPFPLPVRWEPAPAGLTDRPENIQRLGPGGTPREVNVNGDLGGVLDVYCRIPSGRLTILGRAGSGKSVLTIRLTLDLLEAPATHGRVPVIFSISSWDPTATALRDWLIGRLLRDHPHLARRGPYGTTLAAALVDADLVLPVLDGFDEIAEGLRGAALDALNTTSSPLVLTSRRDEYAQAVQAAHAPLVWAAAIELVDLTPDDLAGYLPRTVRTIAGDTHVTAGTGGAGDVWDTVLEELRTRGTPAGANLATVLTTPLMVILARTLYSEMPGRDPSELLDAARFPTAKALEEHLLAGFVPAVYRHRAPERDAEGRRPRSPGWDSARAERWLGYLAHHLVGLDRDRHDLAWWHVGDSLSRATRTLVIALATALSVTLADWLIGLLLTPLGIGELLLQGALMGPVAGLAFGSVYALMDRSGLRTDFEPARIRVTLRAAHDRLGRSPLRTFIVRFGHGMFGGSVMGIGCACALALERSLYSGIPLAEPRVIEGTLINMLFLGLTFGSAAGLVFGLIAALEAPVDVTAAATPVSALASNRTTVGRQFLVLATALTVAIAFGGYLLVLLLQGSLGRLNWAMPDSLFIGSIGGLGGAGSYVLAFTAWGQWFVFARVWLPLTGRLPWDLVAFLEDAYHRGVLRQTGAVYQFRHVRLQHHLGSAFRRQDTAFAPVTLPSPRTGADAS